MISNNLSSFFNNIRDKVLFSFKEKQFDDIQTSLLEKTFDRYQKKSETDLFSSTLFIFYFILKTFKNDFSEQDKLLATFCTLYILSLDLFDDVQDNDLVGKPHEKIGASIAINNAITLLFLSFEFLTKSIELETNQDKKLQYLKVFNKASILAVKGQHKDLMGYKGVNTTQDVLDMQKEKASSVSLIAQCASIISGCDNELVSKFEKISEQMILIFQIVDDIRDIYGKKVSPDLLTDKVTYPIACFFESADEENKKYFNELKKDLPNSLKEIRSLLYSSGAIKKSSETIEAFRVNIHKDLASLNIYSPSIRTMLFSIDSLASSVYKTPFIKESEFILKPKGEWDKHIEKLVNTFFYNMEKFNPPQKPEIFPWHLPQWMYEPKRNIIFYSDIEGQADEILPIHSSIMNIEDLNIVKDIIIDESPLVMSHELFHYWRKESGNMTLDSWYEEFVAHSLSISYIKTFLPDLAIKTLSTLDYILSLKKDSLSLKGKEILNNVFHSDYIPSSKLLDYQVDFEQIAIIQFYMMKKLYDSKISLEENIKRFL